MSRVFLASVLSFMVFANAASAENFKNGSGGIWADTPQGEFECVGDSAPDQLQVLKLDGEVIYREPAEPPGYSEYVVAAACGDAPLTEGIYMGSRTEGSCPRIIANRDGFVVVRRQFSPPGSQGPQQAGIFGIGVINFNLTPPTITELADLQTTPDFQLKCQLVWEQNGLTLHYYGYPYNVPGGTSASPKPKLHTLRFNFSSCSVSQIR